MKHNAETREYIQTIVHGTRGKLVVIKSALGRYRQSRDDSALDRAENSIEQLFGFLSQLAAEIRTPDDYDGTDDHDGASASTES